MRTRIRHAAHPLPPAPKRRPINYEALYASSSPTGLYRDSIGYEILREQAYEAQRRGYVLRSPLEDDE